MAYKIISVAMAPLLFAQGYLVKKNTLELPEAKGSRTGITGKGKRHLSLMILGDSAAAGVGVETQTQALSGQVLQNLTAEFCIQWQLTASTGASTTSTISTLNNLPAKQFDVVVVSLGVNDVTANISLRKYAQGQQHLVTLLRTKFAAKLIVFSAIPPMHLLPALPQPLRWYLGGRARRLNNKLADWLNVQQDCFLLEPLHQSQPDPEFIAADGFHPGEKYYAWWGQKTAKIIAQHLAD